MGLFEGPVNYVAEVLQLQPGAVRILSGIFICQIFSLLDRVFISKIKHPDSRLLIHLILGTFVSYFVWDVSCIHHLASALGLYLLFATLPWSLAAKLNFVYQLGYITVGYYLNNMVEDYTINWTTTMATVTLKMIGLGFDLNDNKEKGAKLPSVFKVFGHVLFIGTYLVGPMDDFKRFEAFINGSLFDETKGPKLTIGLKRLALGLLFLAISVLSTAIFTTETLFTDWYLELPIVLRIAYIACWGHFNLYRYMAVWCIAESSCIHMGYTFNGENRWDGLRNFATRSFHTSLTVQGLIDTWNIKTSLWCSKHIYKRCKFLGNKTLSQLLTMLFLAIWHGVHVGYFVFFFQEFLYGMVMEKGASQNVLLQRLNRAVPKVVTVALRWTFIKVFMSFTFVSFEVFYLDKILFVYGSVYFICPIVALILIASNYLFAEKKRAEKQE